MKSPQYCPALFIAFYVNIIIIILDNISNLSFNIAVYIIFNSSRLDMPLICPAIVYIINIPFLLVGNREIFLGLF